MESTWLFLHVGSAWLKNSMFMEEWTCAKSKGAELSYKIRHFSTSELSRPVYNVRSVCNNFHDCQVLYVPIYNIYLHRPHYKLKSLMVDDSCLTLISRWP